MQGCFVIQISGLMSGEQKQLTALVVPDSGTQELVGEGGIMQIEIIDGQHIHHFDYALPQ